MPDREPPAAPHADAVVPVLVGTAAWLVALVVGLVIGADPPWVQVCAVGLGLGLVGSLIVLRRRDAYRRAGKSASGQG
jgi:Protein of unknown function (DUF2530)